jgi:hypothetical protein
MEGTIFEIGGYEFYIAWNEKMTIYKVWYDRGNYLDRRAPRFECTSYEESVAFCKLKYAYCG